jgi:hypothetical protein
MHNSPKKLWGVKWDFEIGGGGDPSCTPTPYTHVCEQDKQDEESESESTDGVFETSSKSDLRDLFMAKSGYHLTYLGSLQVCNENALKHIF